MLRILFLLLFLSGSGFAQYLKYGTYLNPYDSFLSFQLPYSDIAYFGYNLYTANADRADQMKFSLGLYSNLMNQRNYNYHKDEDFNDLSVYPNLIISYPVNRFVLTLGYTRTMLINNKYRDTNKIVNFGIFQELYSDYDLHISSGQLFLNLTHPLGEIITFTFGVSTNNYFFEITRDSRHKIEHELPLFRDYQFLLHSEFVISDKLNSYLLWKSPKYNTNTDGKVYSPQLHIITQKGYSTYKTKIYYPGIAAFGFQYKILDNTDLSIEGKYQYLTDVNISTTNTIRTIENFALNSAIRYTFLKDLTAQLNYITYLNTNYEGLPVTDASGNFYTLIDLENLDSFLLSALYHFDDFSILANIQYTFSKYKYTTYKVGDDIMFAFLGLQYNLDY
jgi:hypothetical protein